MIGGIDEQRPVALVRLEIVDGVAVSSCHAGRSKP
jgi:hypothetical protein